MKHIWTVMCEKSTIDNDTNIISIFNCIENLNLQILQNVTTPEQLSVPISLQLISFWDFTDDKDQIIKNKDWVLEGNITLVDPLGKELNNFDVKFPISSVYKRYRSRVNINGLNITSSGKYHFKLKIKEGSKLHEIADVPLSVEIDYKK